MLRSWSDWRNRKPRKNVFDELLCGQKPRSKQVANRTTKSKPHMFLQNNGVPEYKASWAVRVGKAVWSADERSHA